MAEDLTPIDVVLAACNQAYEIENGQPHPSVPTAASRFLSVWHALRLPNIFDGWGGLYRWFTGQKA